MLGCRAAFCAFDSQTLTLTVILTPNSTFIAQLFPTLPLCSLQEDHARLQGEMVTLKEQLRVGDRGKGQKGMREEEGGRKGGQGNGKAW